jgi:radial spoke head protein 4A
LLPSDVQAARDVKVLFSGDLDKKIVTNPFFFKRESNFLRAQLARISFGTTIVPKGLYKTTDENDKEIEDFIAAEGVIVPPTTTLQMSKVDMWVHYTQNILKCNRLGHID